MAHSVLFLNIVNFWLSVVRAFKNEPCHFLEKAGRYFCYIGYLCYDDVRIIVIYFDSYTH